MKNSLVTGLDIGTSKICAAIACTHQDDGVQIKGIGLADAKGINKGFVSNLDKLIDSVNKAVRSAEEKAGLAAHNVVANISGPSIAGSLCEGLIPLARRGREITRNDISRVIEITKDTSLSLERDLLYAVPHEFIVDDNNGIENPLGLFGTKLKVKLYVITALATHLQNISKAINYAGYELLDIVPTAIAAQSCILRNDDLRRGAAVIDIGGGITEMAVFDGGVLRYFDTVSIGGMDLTAHLSAHLKLPFNFAEKIKKKYGGISKEDLRSEKQAIFDIDDRDVSIDSSMMNNLLKDRFDEIFYIIKDRLARSSHDFSASTPSIVMTGGGALLSGALETFEDFFKTPARIGRANGIKGDSSILSNPVYATAIGLAKYGLERHGKRASRALKGRFFLLDAFLKFRDMLEEYF